MDILFRPHEHSGKDAVRHNSISSLSSASNSSTMSVDNRHADEDVDMTIPELSGSYESTRSFDLRTPIKPTYAPLGALGRISKAADGATRRQNGFDMGVSTWAGHDVEIAEAHLTGEAFSKDAPHRALEPRRMSEDSQAILADRRSQLGLSLGLDLRGLPPVEGTVPDLVGNRQQVLNETILERRSNKSSIKTDAPLMAAHRLKINLPSAEPFESKRPLLTTGKSLYPQTPGGSVCSTARDGAVSGGPPMSPFQPPTPLRTAQEPRMGYWSSATVVGDTTGGSQTAAMLRSPSTPTAPLSRVGLQRVGSSPLSPLSTEFASSMSIKRPDRRPLSRSGGSTDASSSASSGAASGSSNNTALTPPFSPIALARSLPGDDALTHSDVGKNQRSGTAGSTGSVGSSKKRQSDAGHNVARSLSATRSKYSKPAKPAPYPSREEINLPPSPLSQPSSQSTAETSLTNSPVMLPAPLSANTKLKAPVAGLKIPSSSPMTKAMSAPAPAQKLTVSARHLSNHRLHADFARQYQLGDELGSGGFGFVVRATRLHDGFPVAVKFIFKDKVPNHGWVRDPNLGVIPMEAFVLKVVKHPGVVKFIDLFDDDTYFYLIMEHHGTPWQAPEPSLATPKKANEAVAQVTTPSGVPVSAPMASSKSQPANAQGSPSFAIFPPESTVASPLKLDTALPSSTADEESSITPVSAISPSKVEALRPAPMERRSSCDLFECIEQHSRLSENKARWVFAQIVEAVYHLDTMGITHRDIKDENCVVDADFNVKLIDFGSAVIADPRKPPPFFNRFFGTMTFASSEILQGQAYRAPQAEVWSLGVLLSILLSGEGPFADQDAAMRGKITRPKGAWSHDALNLLLGCLEVNPDRRATIAQVREHPWVRSAWSLRGVRRPSS